MRHVSIAALAFLLLLTASSADAKPVRDLWATVNLCDTKKSPDTMGVRARMPGDGTHRKMYMRFSAQFKSGGRWKPVGGHSKWLYAGSALFRNREYGYTFPYDPPKPGTSYLLRGLVQFQWRAPTSGSVVRRTHRYTTKGHRTATARPKHYSRATCRIATPAEQG